MTSSDESSYSRATALGQKATAALDQALLVAHDVVADGLVTVSSTARELLATHAAPLAKSLAGARTPAVDTGLGDADAAFPDIHLRCEARMAQFPPPAGALLAHTPHSLRSPAD